MPDAAVYTAIGALAALENVFPPVPADTAVALGAFLSSHGTVSASGIFAVTWSANVASATGVYLAGRTLGRQFFAGRLGRRLLKPRRLARIEQLYERHGAWGIFLSRFIPGVRAVVPPFAGIARVGAMRALVPAALASGIWYAALTFLVATSARQIEDVARFVTRLNWVAAVAAAAVAAAIVLGIRRRARKPRGAP